VLRRIRSASHTIPNRYLGKRIDYLPANATRLPQIVVFYVIFFLPIRVQNVDRVQAVGHAAAPISDVLVRSPVE
jgi:hypothetical protein